MRRILAAVAAALIISSVCAMADGTRAGVEFFYYDESPGSAGRTGFHAGSSKDWGVEQRIDYLSHYANFLKSYYGGLELDEYATPVGEVQRAVNNLKPQPGPAVRRAVQLDTWRHALSETGEKDGWTAPGFDDSGWEETERLPFVVKGDEERDLWMRTNVSTVDYEKAFLRFESVLGNFRVWVNGRRVVGPDAYHTDSAPFEVDVTSWLDRDADNQVTINVQDYKQRGRSSSKDEPSKYIGWGVPGRAYLVQTGETLIDNMFVFTDKLEADGAVLKVRFTLRNYSTVEFGGSAEVQIRKWFPAEAEDPVVEKSFDVSLLGGSGTDSPTYYALDFGTENSPLMPGFDRVTPGTGYDAEKGYGWDRGGALRAVDWEQVPMTEFTESDLKRDAVEGGAPASFRLDTDPGNWAFRFMVGSPDRPPVLKVKYIDDFILDVSGGKSFRQWEFTPVHLTQYVRGNSATLKLYPPDKGEIFTINGLEATNHVPRRKWFEKEISVPAPEPWSPENPNLYEIRMTLRDAEGKALDDAVATFGIVKLEEGGGDLYVNGTRYRLRGALETHSFPPEPDDDLTCIAPPDKWIARDILDSRRANMNLLRFHPAEALGTNYLRWLEYADQLGIFVIWAPREWLHWGNHGPDYFLPLLESQLEPSMIAARNHPSIFAWEGGNETYYNDGKWDHRARQFCDEFYSRANSLDPSRFILPVSFWYAQFDGKPEFYRIDPNRGNEVSYPGSGPAPLSFHAPNVIWDVHPYAGWYGGWAEIWWNAGSGDHYRHDRVFMVSEFGAEGMPNWELYRDEDYYHVWDGSSHPGQWEKERLGRNLDFNEWELSQAYQALVMYNNIAVFRTEDADGLAICTGAEGRHNGEYFKGLRDMHRRPKLAYYVTGDAYRPLFIEGLNGDSVLGPGDALRPVIVNEGPPLTADIGVTVRDESGRDVYSELIERVDVPGWGNVRPDVEIFPKNLRDGGYYYVEFNVMESGD